MTDSDLAEAREDLAFMRSLVSGGGGRFQEKTGEVFLWGGLLYGLQCVGHWLQIVGAVDLSTPAALALGFGPTAIFLVVLGVIIWNDRNAPQAHGSARALNAVFQGAGLANLATIVVFAYGAYKAQNFSIWLYHPVMVCLFLGVAWFVAWTIRRRAWLGLVSLGWFAVTIACGLLIDNPAGFLLTIGAGLIVLMALPGWTMMRLAREQR